MPFWKGWKSYPWPLELLLLFRLVELFSDRKHLEQGRFWSHHPKVMMVGREGGRSKGSGWEHSAWCVLGGGWGLFTGGREQKPLSVDMVLSLIHCVLVEKANLAGFLSSHSNKSLPCETFTALNVKITLQLTLLRCMKQCQTDACLLDLH